MENKQKALPHPRVSDIEAIAEALNIWATAPGDPFRTASLKAALGRYKKAVRAQQYSPLDKSLCRLAPSAREVPAPIPGSFLQYFPSGD